MSNLRLIIEERSTQIGNFKVGRLLPFREKRMVGPFAFIDHMGPAQMKIGEGIDIPPHPHIGLSTLTYLFDGCILHKDSLGTEMEILPGEVNWMTAGKGIVHSEQTPQRLKNSEQWLHGLQIWVALPKDLEEMDPRFSHIAANALPNWQEDGVHYKLISGSAFGHTSPVPVYSPQYFIEIRTEKKTRLNLGEHLFGESGIYILEGAVIVEGQRQEPKKFLVAENASLCEIELEANTCIYVFGGEPFPEERFIYWNFVSSSKERIEKAKQDWLEQKFAKVPGETEFVPLPPQKK